MVARAVIILVATSLVVIPNISIGQKDCALCLHEGKYYSNGSIITQATSILGESGIYPHQCKNGDWIMVRLGEYANQAVEPNIPELDRVRTDLVKQAKKCKVCLYGNLSYSNGSLLCFPALRPTILGDTYPYKCNNGKWENYMSTPCPRQY